MASKTSDMPKPGLPKAKQTTSSEVPPLRRGSLGSQLPAPRRSSLDSQVAATRRRNSDVHIPRLVPKTSDVPSLRRGSLSSQMPSSLRGSESLDVAMPRRASQSSVGSQLSDSVGREIDVAGWASPRRSPKSQHRHIPVRSYSEQVYGYDPPEVQLPRRSQSIPEPDVTKQTKGNTNYRLDKCCIHVPTTHEKKECWITGCAVLSPDRVVVVDSSNFRVKVVSTTNSEIVSRIVLSACPKDVAMVAREYVAVTLPSLDTVQYLSIKGPEEILEMSESFTVEGYCTGIDYCHENLFVSYSLPPKVEVFSLDGVLLKSFANDFSGIPLFKNPQYLAANGDAIFVSDADASSVIKLSCNGEVLAKYTDPALQNPQGVAISSENRLLVCSQGNHALHLLGTNCEKDGVVLCKDDGLWWPHVVDVCQDTKTVYIGSTSGQPDFDNYLSMYTFND